MTYESPVERAKKLRSELRANWPTVKFWVTAKESIRIMWVDGPTIDQVDAVSQKYSSVSRCKQTGGILSGGNIFCFTERRYSKDSYFGAARELSLLHRPNFGHSTLNDIGVKKRHDGRGVVLCQRSNTDLSATDRSYISHQIESLLKTMDLVNGFPQAVDPEPITEPPAPEAEIQPTALSAAAEIETSNQAPQQQIMNDNSNRQRIVDTFVVDSRGVIVAEIVPVAGYNPGVVQRIPTFGYSNLRTEAIDALEKSGDGTPLDVNGVYFGGVIDFLPLEAYGWSRIPLTKFLYKGEWDRILVKDNFVYLLRIDEDEEWITAIRLSNQQFSNILNDLLS
jgi:hypothetical protein